jgi:hypothetical protein
MASDISVLYHIKCTRPSSTSLPSLSVSKSIVHISLSLFSFHLKGNGGFKNKAGLQQKKNEGDKKMRKKNNNKETGGRTWNRRAMRNE